MKMPFLVPLVVLCLSVLAVSAETAPNEWYSLDGKPVAAGNAVDDKGTVRSFSVPVMQVKRSAQADVHGTVLLFPGGAYTHLEMVNEGARTAETLNGFGYDVVILEYHVGGGDKSRDPALADALAAWRLVTTQPDVMNVHRGRTVVMGYSAGGHLAARMTQALTGPKDISPDDVMLVYPAYLDELKAGQPKVQPPSPPKSRLTVIFAANDKPEWIKGAEDYTDAWTKADGYAIFQKFKDGGHGFGMKPDLTGDIAKWPQVLNYFLENGPKPGVGPFNTYLPWFLDNEKGRLAQFKKDKAASQGAVVFFGDSITAKWNQAEAFPMLKIANCGIAGDTTRGMLYRFQDNVLDLHPKAIVFMGGINDLSQQPKGTPETIATNVRSMLEQIRAAAPTTPVLLCETLPSKSAPLETICAVNAAVDKVIADYPNAHRVKTYAAFLNPDGTENSPLFLDGTHPNLSGYEVWKSVLKPELEKYVTAK